MCSSNAWHMVKRNKDSSKTTKYFKTSYGYTNCTNRTFYSVIINVPIWRITVLQEMFQYGILQCYKKCSNMAHYSLTRNAPTLYDMVQYLEKCSIMTKLGVTRNCSNMTCYSIAIVIPTWYVPNCITSTVSISE